ncbi:hypothetical protein CMV_021819 [Castanea mollissima]|uniref:NB-ARC domain-containing protein n=1 Tax=Castanea mollissima TaxID=60419 RepID=A0A8J4QF12_9ROSI|nr:hypothetical protein CMV_021819 [Castanea mollissima]
MATEVPVSILLRKLQKLLEEERFTLPGLRNRVVTAANELEKILCLLKAAKPNHENTSNSTSMEASLLRTIYSAEYFTESFILQRRQKGLIKIEMPLPFSPWSQLQFCYKMKKLVQGVRAVSTEVGKPQGQPLVLGDKTDSISEIREGQICRRHHHLVDVKEELVARLINDDEVSLRVISLVSKEALGKTYLAKDVYDRLDIQQHFEWRAWLVVSGDLEYEDFLVAILKQLPRSVSSNSVETMSEKELSDTLLQFSMEHNFLIVLDDVQTVDVLLKLVRLLAGAVNGSRVILTTRNLKVAFQVDPRSSPLEIWPLIDQDLDVFIVGREDSVEELVSRLINPDDGSLRVISVVGEEAIGKTALARNVYNRLDIRQRFPWRVWLHVFSDLEYKDLLLLILKQLPRIVLKDLEFMSEKELSDMLFKFLMEHRFLIVLDDVQTVDVWLKLVRPFADTVNGSRVILITRNSNVAIKADPWSSPLKLSPLSEEKSWKLFLKKVGRQEYNTKLDIIKVDILKVCNGLPLAIVLLGGVLSAIEFKDWSRAINLALAQRSESQSPLLKIVDYSYHQLPSVLRPCFLYLALFPKAYEIPIRRLLQLWLAEGFLQFLPNEPNPEYEAKKYFEELVCRNMIEIARWKSDGSPKTCRLPSFLYDVFVPKAMDIGFLHVHHCKSNCTFADSPELYIPRLADQFGVESSTSKGHIRQLCSYVSFNSQKQDASNSGIGTFLKTMINKRGYVLFKVLDLEGVYKPLLPAKLSKLQNLRYIGLRWTALDSCPASIGDLPCLETLDLKYTNIITLPCSIWKAKRLRHLYINEMSIWKPPKESLPNLQILTALHIGAKSPMINGLKMFINVRKLELTCHSKSAKRTAECISQIASLQTLRLKSRDPFGQPLDLALEPMKGHQSLSNLYLFGVIIDAIDNLPQNLRTLTLSTSKLENDPMPVLGKLLPQLNVLRLFARSYVGSKMSCLARHFPKLRVMKMWMLEKLEEWKVEEGAMPNLVELEIRGCEKLKTSDGLEKLASLKELILTKMPEDFVADVRRKLGRDILLTNKWYFSPLDDPFLMLEQKRPDASPASK